MHLSSVARVESSSPRFRLPRGYQETDHPKTATSLAVIEHFRSAPSAYILYKQLQDGHKLWPEYGEGSKGFLRLLLLLVSWQ